MANKDEARTGQSDQTKKADFASGMSASADHGNPGSAGAPGVGSDHDVGDMAENANRGSDASKAGADQPRASAMSSDTKVDNITGAGDKPQYDAGTDPTQQTR